MVAGGRDDAGDAGGLPAVLVDCLLSCRCRPVALCAGSAQARDGRSGCLWEADVRRTPRDTEATAKSVTRRALFMGGCMAAMVAALGGRMRYLGIEQADEFKLLAEENRINIRLIPPARGLIQDRNGKLIAGNEQNYRVVITREDAGDVEAVLNRLSLIIPITAEDMAETLKDVERNSPFVPVTVADRLNWDDFSKIAVN